MERGSVVLGSLALGVALGGCEPTILIKPHQMDGFAEARTSHCEASRRKVDVLIVLDDSPSMAEESVTVAQNLPAFVDLLENEGVDADYRIAVTTTGVEHSGCDGTIADDGALLASSCRGRHDDFVVGDSIEGEAADVSAEACTDVCGRDELPFLPTKIDTDGDARVRPWLERILWKSNLADGVTTREALACMVPQGISGCTFESPLEAAYRALRRTWDSSDPAYGFVRDDALLQILIVTDEVDGSLRAEYGDVLSPEGDRALWSDPELSFPTSAVAWNAGVECTGGPGTYEECHAVDRGLDGTLADPEYAVLHPLDRYRGLLHAIEQQKLQRNDWSTGVVVSVLGGVSTDYENGGELVYRPPTTPTGTRTSESGLGARATRAWPSPPCACGRSWRPSARRGPTSGRCAAPTTRRRCAASQATARITSAPGASPPAPRTRIPRPRGSSPSATSSSSGTTAWSPSPRATWTSTPVPGPCPTTPTAATGSARTTRPRPPSTTCPIRASTTAGTWSSRSSVARACRPPTVRA